MRYLVILFLLSACTDSTKSEVEKKVVDVKFCLQACRATEFENFHGVSSQFLGGASSSSMNGLSQGAIYDRVDQECRNFYQGVQCCEATLVGANEVIYGNHGYHFGQCRK